MDHFLQVSDVTFEDMVLGEQETASMPWAIKFKISSGLIRNVSFRNIRIGKVGDTPWMYPQDTAAAFMIDFFDKNTTDPKTWVQDLTFEDISVVGAKHFGHFSGPATCIEGLVVRNVTIGGVGEWQGCSGVDNATASIADVSPPLSCRGCV